MTPVTKDKEKEIEKSWGFSDIEDHISALIVRLYEKEVFYATCVGGMAKTIEDNLPAPAAVSIRNATITLSVNPKMFLEFNILEQTAILKHEVMHLLLQHITRRELRHPRKWNYAVDMVVNSMIENIPESCVFPEAFGFPLNLPAETYYEMLPDEDDKEFKIIDCHEDWEDSDEEGLVHEVVKGMVKEALDKSRGSVPREIEQFLPEILRERRVPWEVLLRNFVGTLGKTLRGVTWKKPNRRFSDAPGSRRIPMLNLVVAIDTSGSISDYELGLFFGEIDTISKDKRNHITIIECDARVGAIYEYKGKPPSKITGRGGTYFTPAIEAANEMYPKPDGIVYLTDGYGENPDRCTNIPTMWVITPFGANPCARFGKFVQMRKTEKDKETYGW